MWRDAWKVLPASRKDEATEKFMMTTRKYARASNLRGQSEVLTASLKQVKKPEDPNLQQMYSWLGVLMIPCLIVNTLQK